MPRDVAMFRGGHQCGYSLGQKTGEARGYRKGFAAAAGEAPLTRDDLHVPSRKPRTYAPVR